jgi:toxin secretion/phage lysis holin
MIEMIKRALPGMIASLGMHISGLLGGWDTALGIMFLMMGLDYLTGILAALLGKSDKTESGGFKSSAAFKGLTRKLLMIILVAMAAALDRVTGAAGVCRACVIGFYAANEGMSIIENAGALGVPVPAILSDLLKKVRNKADGGDGDGSGE